MSALTGSTGAFRIGRKQTITPHGGPVPWGASMRAMQSGRPCAPTLEGMGTEHLTTTAHLGTITQSASGPAMLRFIDAQLGHLPFSADDNPIVSSRYEIEGPLGHGGMSAVYKAKDLTTGDPVALKLFPPDKKGQMLAEMAAFEILMPSPWLVGARDHNRDFILPYIAMSYLDGRTLGEEIGRARKEGEMIPLPKILDIMMQICWGLEAIHEVRDKDGHSLVHGDLKPGNVMLSFEGFATLFDMGLTGLFSSDRIKAQAAAGKIGAIGTPLYMDGKRFHGVPADVQSDIMAAGYVMYEIAALQHLYEALGRDEYRSVYGAYNASQAAVIAATKREIPVGFYPGNHPRLFGNIIAATISGTYTNVGMFKNDLNILAQQEGIDNFDHLRVPC